MNDEGEPMSHRKNLLLGLGVALLTVLGSVSVADAQGYPPPYYPPPPPPPPRHGVFRAGSVWGFALGLGDVNSASCPTNGCGGAFAAEGHLGGMISPRTAIMFEAWGADHPYSLGGTDHETINSFWTGAAQFWINDIFWVKGGAGLGVLHETADAGYDYYTGYTVVSSVTHSGFALFGAAGVEILQSYNFALDIQGRIGSGFYSDSGGNFSVQDYAIMAGFNWY
jgi:hypothetical protein